MAYNDPNASEDLDESADTASFQRFVVREGPQRPAPAGSGRGFRLLSLGIGVVVLIVIVMLLLQ